MSCAARLPLMTEGHKGSRIDLEEGGRYLGILQHDVCASVHDCPKNRVRYRMAVFDFIEGWYNPHRRHSGLDYESPIGYEQRHPVVA